MSPKLRYLYFLNVFLHLTIMGKNNQWDKEEIEGFSKDVLKYKKFKNTLKKHNEFSNDDQAIEYYYSKLDELLKIANRSLETLLSEHSTSNFPSEESEIANIIVKNIDKIQGF